MTNNFEKNDIHRNCFQLESKDDDKVSVYYEDFYFYCILLELNLISTILEWSIERKTLNKKGVGVSTKI